MGTGSFPGVKYGRGVLLTTHPLLVLRSWKIRAVPLTTIWATTGPVAGTLYLYVHGESDFSRKHATLIRCDIRNSEHFDILVMQLNHVVWVVRVQTQIFSPISPPQCCSLNF